MAFASLAAVTGLEDDLPKLPAKRLKASWSCSVGLEDAHRGSLPAPVAGKKQADPGRRQTGGGGASATGPRGG